MKSSVHSYSSVKAVVCSVYGTLLERGPAPGDAEQGWRQLWHATFNAAPRLSLAVFNDAADMALQADDARARTHGVEIPAPYWPAVAAPLLPELAGLADDAAAEFLYAHAQLRRTVKLIAGAGDTLRKFNAAGILLGLISNGHPHTPVELALALRAPQAPVESFIPPAAAHGVFPGDSAAREMEIFTPPICFWSFSHGFGKPDPHVFQHVATRLRARRIRAAEVLMIGENETGDLLPARKFGWQTWHLTPLENTPSGRSDTGDWPTLARAFDGIMGH